MEKLHNLMKKTVRTLRDTLIGALSIVGILDIALAAQLRELM